MHSPRRDRALLDLRRAIQRCVEADLVSVQRATHLRTKLEMGWPQTPENLEWVDVWRDLIAGILHDVEGGNR